MPAYKDEKSGKWYVQFWYTDYNGTKKKKMKRGFDKKKEAQNYEAEFKLTTSGSSEITFKSLVNDYLEDSSHRFRETTIENKKYLIETKILPFFGDMPINKIDAITVRKWQNFVLKQTTKEGKKLSQTYIKSINNQLSAVLNYAVKFYNLPNNPVHKTGSIGKKNAESMDFWTVDEFEKFIAQVSNKIQSLMIFNLLFWTGMRSGELLALTLNDFDRQKKTVSINKSYIRLNKKDIISKPKTPKSNRIITLPEFIFKMLDEYLAALVDYESDERLFTVTKFYLQHEMKRGCKNSGVKKIRVHDLRHSHASLLIELNFSPLLIQERLGHEDIQTTLNTYAHLYPNKQEEVSNKLNKIKNGIKSESE